MELFVQQPQKGSYPVPKTLTPEFKLPFENYCVPLRYNYRCEGDVKTLFLNSAVVILLEGIADVPKKRTAQKCFHIYTTGDRLVLACHDALVVRRVVQNPKRKFLASSPSQS